jgi:hypothetical protein
MRAVSALASMAAPMAASAAFSTAAVAALFFMAAPAPATAASPAAERLDCASAARQAIREQGGRLLSVRINNGQCVISILVQREKSRPRKLIIRADPKK